MPTMNEVLMCMVSCPLISRFWITKPILSMHKSRRVHPLAQLQNMR